MLSYVRYAVIAMSVVFLLATSVTAAMTPQPNPTANQQRSQPDTGASVDPKPETPAASDSGEHTFIQNTPNIQPRAPQVSEPVAPAVSAPVRSLPTAQPPDPDAPPREINPRQNPQQK